jgi:signal transduction histidine kinase
MALGNLVDNAIKYTPDGKRITVELDDARPKEVRISITDEGVGIAPDDLTKLFQKFSRIPNARSVSVGGTGLGLYWARQIIKLHGGSIQVRSKVGQGTTFCVVLPK